MRSPPTESILQPPPRAVGVTAALRRESRAQRFAEMQRSRRETPIGNSPSIHYLAYGKARLFITR